MPPLPPSMCAYVRARATPEQTARLSAADVARKRARTSAAWPPLEDLERLFHEHGSRWIAERLGVQRGTVTRRIKQERARRGLPTRRLNRLPSDSLTKPLAHM